MWTNNCHTVDFGVSFWNIPQQADITEVERIGVADEILVSVDVLLQRHPGMKSALGLVKGKKNAAR